MEKVTSQRMFLIVLYLGFVSFGLPDAILGAAWPQMRHTFGKTLEYAGILMSMTAILSAAASIASGFLVKRLSTWAIITLCGFITAAAMLGYALSATWLMLLFFTALFGIGQGAADTVANACLSRHYSSRHMNWVYCCWGIGATGGPLVITAVFSTGASWRTGYGIIAAIQLLLAAFFLLSQRLWETEPSSSSVLPEKSSLPPKSEKTENGVILPPGARRITQASGMLFCFLYSALEIGVGLWGASWLTEHYRVSPAAAAMTITLCCAAVTAGRFLVGMFSEKVTNRSLIRGGIAVAFFACGILVLDLGRLFGEGALILLSFGLAPLFPAMMHDTPKRAGLALSDRLTGFQMGSFMAGVAILPLAQGIIARHAGLQILAPVLLLFCFLILLAHEISVRHSLLSLQS